MEFLEADEEDWGTPIQHMIAGSVAGVVEHIGMYPVDTLKTYAQVANAERGVVANTRAVLKRGGIRGFFRGITAMALGAGPAHAVFFGMYELTKAKLGANMAGHHPIASAVSGIAATIAMDLLMTPADCLKQKMQLRPGKYRSVRGALSLIRSTTGLTSLYAGFTTTLAMNVPYHAVFFASYESYKLAVQPHVENEVHGHLIAGAGSGVTAGLVTNPLDVAKSRLQTQYETGKTYRGMVDALRTIRMEEGIRGFSTGIAPRMVLHSMAGAICWSVYESCKAFLIANQ